MLLSAYEFGRRSLAENRGLLDITSAHQRALDTVLQEEEDDGNYFLRVVAAGRFLDEILSPFEMSRLSSIDANSALRKLYDVLEEEAKRIAHTLHDESAQMLATAYLELADIAHNAPSALSNRVNTVIGHLDEVRAQLRTLSHELRPLILDQLGLIPALRSLADGVTRRSGLQISISGNTAGRQAPPIETALYRTVQEALNNAVRHAQADHAGIQVWVDNQHIHCLVRDNGVGFEVSEERRKTARGLGLLGIHERIRALHGTCRIKSAPGEGTELKVSIPL